MKRNELLADDLRNTTFEMLDAELGFTGGEAGEVAAAVEHAFLCALEGLEDEYKVEYDWTILGDPDAICRKRNPLADCDIMVTARCGEYEGHEYLTGSTFVNQLAFTNSAYYAEMKHEALADLLSLLALTAIKGRVARKMVAALARD